MSTSDECSSCKEGGAGCACLRAATEYALNIAAIRPLRDEVAQFAARLSEMFGAAAFEIAGAKPDQRTKELRDDIVGISDSLRHACPEEVDRSWPARVHAALDKATVGSLSLFAVIALHTAAQPLGMKRDDRHAAEIVARIAFQAMALRALRAPAAAIGVALARVPDIRSESGLDEDGLEMEETT